MGGQGCGGGRSGLEAGTRSLWVPMQNSGRAMMLAQEAFILSEVAARALGRTELGKHVNQFINTMWLLTLTHAAPPPTV